MDFLNHTKFGIDKNVWLTMASVVVASLALLGFKLAQKEGCMPFSITSASVATGKSSSFFVGDPVIVNASATNAQQIAWDFGDHTPEMIGNNAKHIYTRDGNYNIMATVNGQCIQSIPVHISPLKIQTQEQVDALEVNPINGLDAPTAGTPVVFTCSVKAGLYEWNILNSPIFTTQKGEVANYIFPVPGTQIIELRLDGDPTKVYRKQLTILPAKELPKANNNQTISTEPPPVLAPVVKQPQTTPKKDDAPVTDNTTTAPPVEKPKTKLIIADAEFRMKFEAVQRGEADASAFNDFLCDGGNTKVLVENQGNQWMTVASVCQLFHGNKKIKKIYDVSTVRDDKNCVTNIKLKYDKKGGFLGL